MSNKRDASTTQVYDEVHKIMTGEDHDPKMPELISSLLFERMQRRSLVIDNGNIVENKNGTIQDGHSIYSFRIFIVPDGESYTSENLSYQPIQVILETTRLEELDSQCDPIGMYAPVGTFPNGCYPMLSLNRSEPKEYVDEYLESIHDTLGEKIPVINRIHMYHDMDKNINGIPKIHTIYDRNRKVDIIPDAENASANMVLMDNYYSAPDLYIQFGCSYITPYLTECINQIYLKTCPQGDLAVYHEIYNRHMLIGALRLMVKYCEFREFSNYFFKFTRQSEMFSFPIEKQESEV